MLGKTLNLISKLKKTESEDLKTIIFNWEQLDDTENVIFAFIYFLTLQIHISLKNSVSSQKKEKVQPAGGRLLRPRRGTPVTYEEDTSEEEEDEEEEELRGTRPKPIPACYLRGPPIGPRPPPKQVWHQPDGKRENLATSI